MLKTLQIDKIHASIAEWFDEYFWTHDILYQSLIILVCFISGGIFYRMIRKRVAAAIDKSELPVRAKQELANIKRLIFALAFLTALFLSFLATTIEGINIGNGVIVGTMKILLAWIVIRIALQVIANTFTRNVFAVIIWVIAALSILGVLDETTATLDAIGFSIGEFRLSALAVIKGMLSLFALLYIAIFASTLIERSVFKAKSLTRSSQVLLAKVIRITLIGCALIIGITSAGIDLSIFAVFSGAVGLGLGFGLQKVVSNLFSGLLLLLDKSIEPGDVIELEKSQTFGWVHHMGARYTEIVTRDNKSYLIPNEELITQNVVNWSHGKKLIRIMVAFRVHYESDMHRVIEIAKTAATRPARVLASPEPVCLMVEFGDSSVEFSLRFWINDAEAGVSNIKGEVLLSLWDAFKENGIRIPYPQREVLIRNA